jgi:hypothetical protein
MRKKPENPDFRPVPVEMERNRQLPEFRPVGRPRSKRSDPEYRQVTAYIRASTYIAAKKRLLDEQKEFSQLVEELVTVWLAGKPRASK